MAFEINLPRQMGAYALRRAGLETDAYMEAWHLQFTSDDGGAAALPIVLRLPYFLSERPRKVAVTVAQFDPVVRLRVAASGASVERKLRKALQRYSAENDGEAVLGRERRDVYERIDAALRKHRLTLDEVGRGHVVLPRPAIESLIALAGRIDAGHRCDVTNLFANAPVARADRERVCRWLMRCFEENPDPAGRAQLALRIDENATPAVGDDLVRLVRRRRLGDSRAALLTALARSKHAKAAAVVASVMRRDGMRWAGLKALAMLGAEAHVELVRQCLRDADPEVRREAKKTLKKIGHPVAAPPVPVHLVKGKPRIPRGLSEWSTSSTPPNSIRCSGSCRAGSTAASAMTKSPK